MRGLQGAGVPIAACAKHWVADGGTVLGSGTADFAWTGAPYLPVSPLYLPCISHAPRRPAGAPAHVLDQGDVRCGEAELREVHVPPYLPP